MAVMASVVVVVVVAVALGGAVVCPVVAMQLKAVVEAV